MYGIEFNGKFLKKSGTSFCSFPEDAKAFRTPQDAQDYIDYWLKDLGVSVCHLPLKDDDLDENKNIVKLNESQLRQIVAESVRNVLGDIEGSRLPDESPFSRNLTAAKLEAEYIFTTLKKIQDAVIDNEPLSGEDKKYLIRQLLTSATDMQSAIKAMYKTA